MEVGEVREKTGPGGELKMHRNRKEGGWRGHKADLVPSGRQGPGPLNTGLSRGSGAEQRFWLMAQLLV